MGIVYTIYPYNVEFYNVRLLLHHVRESTYYSYLKTVYGIEYPMSKDACMALRLLEDDKQWDITSEEAAICRSLYKMRELVSVIFTYILSSLRCIESME